MPPHPSGYNRRRNKKVVQSCVLVEQQCHNGSDNISNSEQQEAQLQLQEGYTAQIPLGHFVCPVPTVCCLLSPTFLSATKREPNSVYLCNKCTCFYTQSDGKRLKARYNQRTKPRFLSQEPKEHTVNSTSHQAQPADLPGL